MRVLQLGCFAFPLHQGSQVYAGGVAGALARRGHQVWLASYGGGSGRWPEGVVPVTPIGTLPVPRASGPHPLRAALDPALALAVARLLRREAIDVVHAHHVEAPLVALAATRLSGRRPPIVWTPHTSLAEELPVYLPAAAATIASAAGGALDRAVAGVVDAAVVLSPRSGRLLREAGVADVTVVPPGVDPAELVGGDADRARARWRLGALPWVVYTGNTDAYQDLNLLVAAMIEVPRAGLLVVTGGDPRRLLADADRLGLPADRLRVVRSTDFADTLDAIAASALGVLPRRVCAGFPIKLLNLLGAGRAVVASEGSAQPIEGVIPVRGGAHALAGAIRAAVADREGTARLGDAARRAVAARWTWDVRARELEAIYHRVT